MLAIWAILCTGATAYCPSGYRSCGNGYCCPSDTTCVGDGYCRDGYGSGSSGSSGSSSGSGAGVAIGIIIPVVCFVVAITCCLVRRRRNAAANAQMLALSNAQHMVSAQQMAVLAQSGQVAYYQPGVVQPSTYVQGYMPNGAPVYQMGTPTPQQQTTTYSTVVAAPGTGA